MAWPPVSRNEDKGLARYAVDEIASGFPIAIARQDALAQPDGRLRVIEAIYDALSQRKIAYAIEIYDADLRLQHVRPPETILGGAGEGTCLDLALLFGSIALGKELAPLLVMFEGHAIVAVSLDDDRRSAAYPPRRNREGTWLDEGVLRDVDVLRKLVDGGHYVAVECTGFAASEALSPDMPESAHRVDGKLAFDAALKAGRAQLDFARQFRFAIDLAVLRDRDAFAQYDPPLAGSTSPFRFRLERLIDDERLFGGRDTQLGWLDKVIDAEVDGYAFVTGKSGSGKTALLVNWVRTLLERPPAPGRLLRLAYAFISQSYELAEEQSTLELLCQQLLRAHGRQEPLANNVPALQRQYVELLAKPARAGEKMVIVIDGLDEAKGWTPSKLLFPRTLPQGVHVIFSAREVARHDWVKALELDSAQTPILRLAPLTVGAVTALLRGAPPPLAAKAADAAFVRELHRASAGDPFYLKFLIEDLVKLPTPSVADVEAKPRRLKGYLDRWWDDVAKQSKAEKSVRDLLGYLVVALGAVRRDDLIDVDANDALDSFTIDDAITAVKRYVIGSDEEGYSLCHPRFRDYLITDRIRPNDQRPYRDRVTNWCASVWSDEKVHYPIEHVIAHLAAKHKIERPAKRADITAQMLAIMNDPAFRVRKLGAPSGLLGYELDFRAAVRAAVEDPLPAAIPQIAKAALGLTDTRRKGVGLAQLFEAARRGEPEMGEQQLRLIAPDHDWLRACLLVSAWLCALRDPKKAGQFRAVQAETIQPNTLFGTLKLLDDRTVAAIVKKVEPLLQLPYFPPRAVPQHVPRETARAIVARIGGTTDAEEISAHLNPSMIGTLAERAHHGDETPVYIAEGDSPWLVGYAISDPAEGASLIRRYIGVHTENPYGVYRNRSLWGVLGAVLCHPTAALALDLARAICEAALRPAAVEYREMLRLATSGIAAKLGNAAEAERLQACIREAFSQAQGLHPIRSEADTWGHHCRRFAALAEVVALTSDNRELSDKLLDRAISFPFGYAGYQAPASLALADANFACRPQEAGPIAAALNAAQRAAHNVQEARFCALTTARVNAIRRRWRPGTIGNLTAAVERFTASPFDAEFAPVYVVGERYCGRSAGNNMLPIPPEALAARSLEQIAANVYGLPVARLERLNLGIDPRRWLPLRIEIDELNQEETRIDIERKAWASDGEINVSDSDFAPILATRFAAEVLGRRAELGERAAEVIAKLVPAAASNATALDLVLSRLILAAAPADSSIVERVRDLAPSEWMKSPVEGPAGRGIA
jgi:hypothetical protein